MREMDFDEVVTVLETVQSLELGVAGASGVILGKSQGAEGKVYAVLVGNETFMIPEDGLVSTGRHVAHEEMYSGESFSVQAERYSEGGAE